MIEYIINKGKKLNKYNPNNIYTILGDWLVVGLQAGFRRKKWAQDRTYFKQCKDIERIIDNSSAAFIMEDFNFRAKLWRDASCSIFETKLAWFILSLLIQSSSDLGVEPKGSTNAP